MTTTTETKMKTKEERKQAALDAYQKICAAAWDAYQKIRDAAYASRDAALSEYEKTNAAVLDAYEKKVKEIEDE